MKYFFLQTILSKNFFQKDFRSEDTKNRQPHYTFLYLLLLAIWVTQNCIYLRTRNYLDFFRFIARRKLYHDIYSDNEINFGARNKLTEFKKLVSIKQRNSKIISYK